MSVTNPMPKDISADVSLLPDDYIAQANRDARRYQGQWTGTAGTLAAHVRRLILERERILEMLECHKRPAATGLRIIGLAGHVGAGKSLAASMVPESHHLQWADPIYEGLAAMFDVDESVFRCRENKETETNISGVSVSPRRLLQTLGTEWGRDIVHPDIWVRLTMARIERLQDQRGVETFSICGTRFINEVEAIRKRGGEVWWIHRPGVDAGFHKSDLMIGPSDCDRVVDNSDTIERLRASVLHAWDGYLMRRAGT